jgi:hypothetical protein
MDGVERIYGFQRIGEFPLYVATGIATADYLSDWRQNAFPGPGLGSVTFPGAVAGSDSPAQGGSGKKT